MSQHPDYVSKRQAIASPGEVSPHGFAPRPGLQPGAGPHPVSIRPRPGGCALGPPAPSPTVSAAPYNPALTGRRRGRPPKSSQGTWQVSTYQPMTPAPIAPSLAAPATTAGSQPQPQPQPQPQQQPQPQPQPHSPGLHVPEAQQPPPPAQPVPDLKSRKKMLPEIAPPPAQVLGFQQIRTRLEKIQRERLEIIEAINRAESFPAPSPAPSLAPAGSAGFHALPSQPPPFGHDDRPSGTTLARANPNKAQKSQSRPMKRSKTTDGAPMMRSKSAITRPGFLHNAFVYYKGPGSVSPVQSRPIKRSADWPLYTGPDSDAASVITKGPSFDTEDTAVRDALGKEAEDFDMVTPQPHRPDKTLWCEFVELLDCHATFVLDNQDGWIQHHADHLQDTFPSEFCCWFCDGLTFEAPNPTDGHAAFMSRMEHIRQHIFDDPHLTIAQMRPDLNMVERLSFPQRPNHSIDAELALDGLRQFHPVPEGGPDAPVGGLQAPFTDSGYASVLPGRCVSAGTEDKEEDDGDTKTEISAASKAIGPEAQRPISEVSNDIYNQVQRHLDDDNKTLVLGALPNLIKAFAIRLAHLDPSDTSRRIMHFIYSRHQDILFQLRQLFEAELEAEGVSCRGRQGEMSVAEKMLLWSSRPEDEDHPRTPEDAFQGVDDMEDGPSHAEASAYGREILQSKEYRWLIQQLLRESSFHWGPGPRIMVDEIRHSIMSGLPRTERVSKKRGPCVHRAEFRIPWPQLRRRLLRKFKRTSAGWIREAVSTTVVLVSSPDDCILATSVGEYIDRTWGDDRDLLEKFGAILNRELGSTHSHDSKNIDHTQATTRSVPATLSVFAEGVSHSIAEQGEQLAWLVSALQDSENQEIVYNKPSIVKRDARIWEIRVDPTPRPVVNTEGLSTLKKLGWLGEAIEPVIIQGFPTFRRPSSPFATSLELSPMALSELYGYPHLPRGAPAPELAKQIQGVCLWHVATMNEGKEWSCQYNPEPVPGVHGDFNQCRHFVAICPGSGGFENRLDATPPLAAGARIRDLDNTSDSPPALGATGSPPSSPSSPETSLDSDMMSIPDSSEAPLRDIPDQLSSVIGRVADRLFHEYRTGTWGMTSAPAAVSPDGGPQLPPLDTAVDLGTVLIHTRPQGEAGGQHAGRVCHTSDSQGNKDSGTSSRPNLKRAASGKDESQDGDDGQGSMPPPKKRCHGDGLPTLACPYYKMDPVRYYGCANLKKFRAIKTIKQHLARRHSDIHCARCKTVFPNEPAHQRHLEEEVCLFKPWDLWDPLITPSQQKELGKRSKGGSVREQWFAIWDIVFPGRPKPPSPYLGTGIPAEFCEYAMDRGSVVLLEELQAAGFREPNTSFSEEARGSYALQAARRALSAVVGGFLSSQLSLTLPSGPSGTPASEVSSRESIPSVFADSGVSVRDHHVVPPPSQEDAASVSPATLGSRAVFDQSQADLLESAFGSGNSDSPLLVCLPPGANEIEAQSQANPLDGHINTNERILSNLPGPYIPTQGPPSVAEDSLGQSGTISPDLAVTGNGIPDQNRPLWLEDLGDNNRAVVPGFADNHVSGGNPNAAVEVSDGSGNVFEWETASHSFSDWDPSWALDPRFATIPLTPNPPAPDSIPLDSRPPSSSL